MTVKEICDLLAWSIAELARRAEVSYPTAYKAYTRTEPTKRNSKMRILRAFNEVLDQPVKEDEIEW